MARQTDDPNRRTLRTSGTDRRSASVSNRTDSASRSAAQRRTDTRLTRENVQVSTGKRQSTSKSASKAAPASKAATATAADPNPRIPFRDMPLTYKALVGIVAFVVLIIFARLVYLQIFKAAEYGSAATETRTVTITTTPARGTIYDRNGKILAISVPAKTIYAVPSEVEDKEWTAGTLARILQGSTEGLMKLLSGEDNFVYIYTQCPLELAKAVADEELPGIYFLDDTRREYPYGQVGGQIIGFVNEYGEVKSGLELYYDDLLKGTPGTYVAEIGDNDVPIPGGVKESVPAVDGQDIMLTIDITLQEDLENALIRAAIAEGASSTSGIVMDASNGEILAIASLPLDNPADHSNWVPGADTLWPITQIYEPGSIFKTVSAMALLEEGVMKPTDQVFCPAKLEADEYFVTDSDPRDDVIMDLNTIIAVSSNVGIASSVEDRLGFKRFYRDIINYGFGTKTGVDYPGEVGGHVDKQKDWSTIQSYNVTFGQGISVTGLQMVRFYGALANDGIACTPHFLLRNITTQTDAVYDSERIFKSESALYDIATVLRHVITEGTGTMGAIDGYYVVGKSGTAEISVDGKYMVGNYNRSFIGYLVDTSTPIVAYFVAQDVPYEGSIAPVFRAIMQEAIEEYRVTSTWNGEERD